jgi:uncharacterized protein YggE
MKRIVAIALISFSVVAAKAEDLPGFPFLMARGHARKELPPDMVKISFKIEVFDEVSSNALSHLTRRSAEVLQFIVGQKVDQKDIVAHEIEKDTVREKKEYQELKILGYEVRRSISVTLRDLERFDHLMKFLLSTDNVVGTSADFDRSDREKISRELLAAASKDAREEAERLAAGFGVQVQSVYAISQRGFSNIGGEFGLDDDAYYRYLPTFMEADGGKLLFVPATISFNGNVAALFKLKVEE